MILPPPLPGLGSCLAGGMCEPPVGLSPPRVGPGGCGGFSRAWLRLRLSRRIYRRSRAAAPRRRGRAPTRAPAPTRGPRGAAAASGGVNPPQHRPPHQHPARQPRSRPAPRRGCEGEREREGRLPAGSRGDSSPCWQARWQPCPRAHRGGGSPRRGQAAAGSLRIPASVGCGAEPPAVCVSRPAPAAECTTKTTIAPRPPHATGDGDVSSVRETGMLNPLRAGPAKLCGLAARQLRLPLAGFGGHGGHREGRLVTVRASPSCQQGEGKTRMFLCCCPGPWVAPLPPVPSRGRGTSTDPSWCHRSRDKAEPRAGTPVLGRQVPLCLISSPSTGQKGFGWHEPARSCSLRGDVGGKEPQIWAISAFLPPIPPFSQGTTVGTTKGTSSFRVTPCPACPVAPRAVLQGHGVGDNSSSPLYRGFYAGGGLRGAG